MANWIDVAEEDDLEPGEMTDAEAGGIALLVANVKGTFYVTEATCTHQGGPLTEGSLSGRLVSCPWHGSRFDLATGAVVHSPATKPIRTFPTRVDGGKVQADIS